MVPARLHLLAELRAGGQHSRARHDRVRDPAGPVHRRLPGDQAPAASRAARSPGTLARPSDPAATAAPAGLGRARGVDCDAPVLAIRAATAVGADRTASALSRRPPHAGDAGIELTTLLAIAGVGIYTVVLQIDLLQTDALLPGDETALTVARDIEMGVLTTLADVLAVIGRLWFVVPVMAVACGFLLTRRGRRRRSRCRPGWRSRRSRPRSSRAPWTGRGRETRSPTRAASPTRRATLRCRSPTWRLAVVLSRGRPGRLAHRDGDRRAPCWRSRSASHACTCASTT